LELDLKKFGHYHENTAISFNNIGLIFLNNKQYNEAIKFFKTSIDIREKILPSNHPNLGITYNNISNSFIPIKKYLKAYCFLLKAIKIKDSIFPQKHQEYLNSYYGIWFFYTELLKNKNKKRIYPLLIRLTKESKNILDENHFIVNINYLLLSQFSIINEDREFYNTKSTKFLEDFFGLSEGKMVQISGIKKILFQIWSDILMTSFGWKAWESGTF